MISWGSFALVFGVSLGAAAVVVTLFSLALRLGDGAAPWRAPVRIALLVICAAIVLFGIAVIVPQINAAVFGGH